MARKKIKGGTAVFLCTVPPTFKPQRLWDVPDEILSGYLHAKNLAMPVALGFARVHNMTQAQALANDHRPIESWAIVCRHLKPEWHKPADSVVVTLPQQKDRARELANEQEGGAA